MAKSKGVNKETYSAGLVPTNQFGRALRDLGVELIATHSPGRMT